MAPKTYKVLVVDDHPIVRRGLRQLFEDEPGFTVCGEAADAAAALQIAQREGPDLAIIDLSLSDANGIDLTKQLHALQPNLAILILSLYDEELYARRALQTGARGYVTKQRSDDEIMRAARQTLAGQVYVSESIRRMWQEMPPIEAGETPRSPIERLSDREFEVFKLLGEGYPPRHIAEKLNLSVSTVEVYRQNLKEKLNLKSSTQLTRYAVRWWKDYERR